MIKRNKIQNIIFDLGNVLLDVDMQLSTNAFRQAGFSNSNDIVEYFREKNVLTRYETGAISSDEFIALIKKVAKNSISDAQIIEAWNAMLLDYRKNTIDLLKRLKVNYRTFLLSNTNELHAKAFNQQLRKSYDISSLSGLFEKVYYSHVIGYSKPDKKAYQVVLDENKLIPEQTIFIDDRQENVDAAEKLGINGYNLLENEDVCQIFSQF